MCQQDLSHPVPEETVRHDHDPIARTQERVGERLEARVAGSGEREDAVLWRGPEIAHQGDGLGERLDPRVAVMRERRLRELLEDPGMQRHGTRYQQETRIHWNRANYGSDATSICPDTPCHASPPAQSRIPSSETLKTASASGRFGESIRRAIRLPPFDLRR